MIVDEVGGHSPGQTILFIAGETGPDRARLRRRALLRGGRARPRLRDPRQTSSVVYRAYDIIRAGVRAGAALVAGHDPLVMDRFPRLESDPELGVLVA